MVKQLNRLLSKLLSEKYIIGIQDPITAGDTYRFRELLRAGDVLAARGLELEVEVGKVF